MKKIISTVFILLSIPMFSQQNQELGIKSNEKLATIQAKRLSMQLDLNDDQQSKLAELYLQRLTVLDEAQEKEYGKEEEIRKKSLKMNQHQKAELQEILTEEQFKKWEGLMEKRRRGFQDLRKKN